MSPSVAPLAGMRGGIECRVVTLAWGGAPSYGSSGDHPPAAHRVVSGRAPHRDGRHGGGLRRAPRSSAPTGSTSASPSSASCPQYAKDHGVRRELFIDGGAPRPRAWTTRTSCSVFDFGEIRRRALPRDGAGRGEQPFNRLLHAVARQPRGLRAPRRARCTSPGGHGRPRPRLRAPPRPATDGRADGLRAPRRQPGEHPPRRDRPREARRFRDRHGGGARLPHALGAGPGEDGLYVPGAGDGASARSEERRVHPGRGLRRAADRPAALHGQDRHRDPPEDPGRRPHRAARGTPRDSAGT